MTPEVPKSCPNVDTKILMPNKTWADQAGSHEKDFGRVSSKLKAYESMKRYLKLC